MNKHQEILSKFITTNHIKTSSEGYRDDSPDRFNSELIIPSGNITMKNRDGSPINKIIKGVDNLGNIKIMYPGQDYEFPGDWVKETPIAQKGGATRQDSLDVYNNSRKVENFYIKNNYKESREKYSKWKKEDQHYINDEVYNDYFDNKGKKLKSSVFDSDKVLKSEYRKNIDKNKYLQREQSNFWLNTDAPMQLFDRRINPLEGNKYHRGDDAVEIPTYNNIGNKPFDLLTEKEKAQRVKIYGRSGVPDSYNPNKNPQQPVIVQDKRNSNTTTGKQVKENNNKGMVFNETFQAKPRPKVEQLQQIEPRGIQNTNQSIESELPPLREITPQPKYYDITDTVNQNFGGRETDYKWYPENGQPLQELSPNNTRKLTPHYQEGGTWEKQQAKVKAEKDIQLQKLLKDKSYVKNLEKESANRRSQVPTEQYITINDVTNVPLQNKPEKTSVAARNKTNKEIAHERQARIDAQTQANAQPFDWSNFRQSLADRSQATGDALRVSNEPNFFDDYLNPASMIGSMADNLGQAPLQAEQSDSYMPYLTAIGIPLTIGAVAGIGANSTGQFVNNLANPLAGTGDLVNNLGNKYLPNTYKYNPWAFKPNPEAYYRVLGKEGVNDALESGVIRANQKNIHPFSGEPIYDRPYFSKGVPLDRDWKSPFKNKKGKQSVGSIYPDETMVEVFGHNKFYPTNNLVTSPSVTLTPFDEGVNLYKRDWLKGYKQVEVPNQINSSVDDVVQPITPKPWQMQELPGLHLKSTMEGEAISKIIEPKTGLINTEQALAIIGKESGGADKVALIRQGLGDNIPKKMNYNDFRKTVQDQLIPLERRFVSHSSDYGLPNLGYNKYEGQQVVNHKWVDMPKDFPIENKTIILSNKSKLGRGSSAHGNPDETLGHIHFLRDAETPDVLTVTQIQSDAFQGTHRIMPKNTPNATALERQQKSLQRMEELQERNKSILNKMKTDGVDEAGLPVQDYQIKQFEDIVKAQEQSNLFKKADIENFSQKQLLDKNHQERYLQELVDYAGKRGDVNKIRVPTSETAAKVQGYIKETNPLYPEAKTKILNLEAEIKKHNDFFEGNFDHPKYKEKADKLTSELEAAKKQEISSKEGYYSKEHQTILKKYAEQPKTIKKLFGIEPKVVTDSKGNTWYEFDISKKFKEGKGEIKAFGLIPPAIGIGTAIQSQQNKEYKNGGVIGNRGQSLGWLHKYQDGSEVTYNGGNLNEVNIEKKSPAKGFWNQYVDTLVEDHKDDGLFGALLGTPIDAVLSLPQKAMMYGLTGKVQKPSDVIKSNPLDPLNKVKDFVNDAVYDPLNLVGAGLLTKENLGTKLNSFKNETKISTLSEKKLSDLDINHDILDYSDLDGIMEKHRDSAIKKLGPDVSEKDLALYAKLKEANSNRIKQLYPDPNIIKINGQLSANEKASQAKEIIDPFISTHEIPTNYTPREIAISDSYQWGYDSNFNDRAKVITNEKLFGPLREEFEQLIKKTKTKRPEKFFRNQDDFYLDRAWNKHGEPIHNKKYSELQIGDEYEPNSFVSTTLSPTNYASGEFITEIKVPENQSFLNMASTGNRKFYSEIENVLPKNLRFRIDGIEDFKTDPSILSFTNKKVNESIVNPYNKGGTTKNNNWLENYK